MVWNGRNRMEPHPIPSHSITFPSVTSRANPFLFRSAPTHPIPFNSTPFHSVF